MPHRDGEPDGRGDQHRAQQHRQPHGPEHPLRPRPERARDGVLPRVPGPPRIRQRQEHIRQHEDQMRQYDSDAPAIDAGEDRQGLEPGEKRHLRHDQRQVEQPQRARRRAQPVAVLGLETGERQNQREQRRGPRDDQRLDHRPGQLRAVALPVAQGEPVGERVGKLPQPGEGPDHLPRQPRDHRQRREPPDQQRTDPQRLVRAGPPAAAPRDPEAASPGHRDLQAPPEAEARDHEPELQHRARRRLKAQREVRVAHPAHHLHGERRRRVRPEDDRHVHDRHREGQHGVDRQPDLAVDQRETPP